MKFVGSQLVYYLKDRDFRRNTKILLKYILFLGIIVLIYSILFHVIMSEVEGQQHSWITGFYWTLTVMSTLGFGDITFQSDIGRLFSMLVLLTGIISLLIVLPFAFIRHFYAPLLDSRDKNRVPRIVPSNTKDHIIICNYGIIAKDLIERLKQESAPFYLLENVLPKALEIHDMEIPIIFGDTDKVETFKNANIKDAKMVLVNKHDTINTKIILTIRQIAPHIQIVAIATDDESIHVQQLSGANHVLPIKRWLGEQLANRVNSQHALSQPIGQYEDLLIAELTIHNTPLVGKTIRESQLRQKFGVSIVALWERGRLKPITGSEKLTYESVLVLIGNKAQLKSVDELFLEYIANPNPVLLIGGGKVGSAAAETLYKNGISVNLIERDTEICEKLKPICNKVFDGKASDYDLLKKAGFLEAPSILLSTNDDTMNIYLASYCRQLNKEVKIVSRISEARNIDIMHKAGANFVLSYATLGSEAVLSIAKGQQLTILGEGISLFITPTPESLEDKTLAESGIGAETGLSVIAIKDKEKVVTQLTANTQLPKHAEIVMLGTIEMQQRFVEVFNPSN